VHRGRDEHELALLAAARAAGLPVLGVCRGLQLANVAYGGDLVEHVDGHDAGARFALDLHPVHVEAGTLLARATGGGELAVNSLHHQVVGALAAGLRASATAADGVPEAAEAVDGPWLVAVQWHPELMGPVPGGHDLFAALVRESAA
jgi:putative glutamine amidotransferase